MAQFRGRLHAHSVENTHVKQLDPIVLKRLENCRPPKLMAPKEDKLFFDCIQPYCIRGKYRNLEMAKMIRQVACLTRQPSIPNCQRG